MTRGTRSRSSSGRLLLFHGARVLATDAFASDPSFVEAERLVAESDVIVIGAPHSVYRELELPADKPVVDVWGFLGRERVGAAAR